ncbi:MAG TPA: hypothetical protein VIT43_01055 [Candidatus Dormibacteraeota bacterium]
MSQYDVTAIAVDPTSGAVIGRPRVERVDTETNDVFRGCKSPWEVEDRYHAYWNRLDDSWERQFPPGKEKVFVLHVDAVRPSDGGNIVELSARRGS